MMRPMAAGEVTALETTQESSMLDECTIYRASMTEGTYGEDTISYTTSESIPCSFQFTGGMKQTNRGDRIPVDYDAELKLSIDETLLALNDKIVLTKQNGTTSVVTTTFDVYGYGRVGHATWYQLKAGEPVPPEPEEES